MVFFINFQRGRSGSALVLINEVINLRRARLVLGWVTVSGFESRGRYFISVYNQPPRSTQLAFYPPWDGKMSTSQRAVMICDWGVKACMACIQVKLNVVIKMSALENAFGI